MALNRWRQRRLQQCLERGNGRGCLFLRFFPYRPFKDDRPFPFLGMDEKEQRLFVLFRFLHRLSVTAAVSQELVIGLLDHVTNLDPAPGSKSKGLQRRNGEPLVGKGLQRQADDLSLLLFTQALGLS